MGPTYKLSNIANGTIYVFIFLWDPITKISNVANGTHLGFYICSWDPLIKILILRMGHT